MCIRDRRDGLHTSRRRTAASAGLNDTRGGRHKNGYSQIFGHVVVRGPRGAIANLETLLDAATVECDPLPPDSSICAAPVFGDETPCFCLESPEDDWRCAVRYSDDDCTPDSDDECGDEDRRI